MDALLNDLVDQAKSRFEGKIDFNGQKQAERYLQVLLISFGVIAFLVGFTLQNLLLTFGIFAGGLLVSLLAIVPAWPMYNQHPISWLPLPEEEIRKTQ